MVSHTIQITEKEKEPLKYPRSVGFIISNEFCERFNYYGMRTILVLYLTSKLHYDDDTSTVLFHVFTTLVYLCPIAGAIIADSWLGKFKTIFYLSIVYAIGGVIVAIGAIPTLHLPVKEVTIIGLVFIALGTGGIKPCVSAFGGDQFRMPEQAAQLATFFSLFYFAINAGSMISTSITPILREDVHCFGDKDCFSLAFGVPAVLMLLSVLIFIAGKRLYVMKAPAGNMIFGVSKCVVDAYSGYRKNHKTCPRKHFLDYAKPTSGAKMVSETKTLMKILILYLPFPVFWALFDQQGSRWTFQATRMNGDMGSFTMKPDQMQVVNPLLILGFIPLFDYVLYPLLSKVGIKRPLQKLTLGGILAAVAFLLSAFVELKLDATQPVLPREHESHLRIYNGMTCSYKFESNLPLTEMSEERYITALGLFQEKHVKVPTEVSYTFESSSLLAKCPNINSELMLEPGKEISYFIAYDGMHQFKDSSLKHKLGHPQIRVLLNIPPEGVMKLTDPTGVSTKLESYNTSQVVSVARGETIFTVDGNQAAKIITSPGGIYTLLVTGNKKDGYMYDYYVLAEPNTVHMMWQLPQIIVITAAEIMFSVTGLEFSFTQAPYSMKSVLQACWLLSVAIGNMLVVVIAEMKFFQSQSLKYPRSVGYIISNEFCERFNYHGLRTILALYLTSKLHYDDGTSTVLFHVFTTLVYLCPLAGAIIADSWLGKYKTILYLSLIYAIGMVIVAIGAIPTLQLSVKGLTIIGLVFIALGTGGIKPCVSAFGGDQFRMPEQAGQLATFFSLFYFAINAGSVISTSITPILREDVHCFGDQDCFSLAFGVPAAIMLLSVLIFIAGKRLYVMKPPAGNMIFGVSKCVVDAYSGYRKLHKSSPQKHWLNYSESTSGAKMVSETKTLMKILVLYLPFPMFWALFEQQGSRWIFQATRMDGDMGSFTMKPDQMLVLNPLLVLAFIPLFNYILYPLLAMVGIKRPLQKLTLGGLLAATAFILSAFVELKLENRQPVMPSPLETHLRIYNGNNCVYRFEMDITVTNVSSPQVISALGLFEEKHMQVRTEGQTYTYHSRSELPRCTGTDSKLSMEAGKETSYFVTNNGMQPFRDSSAKHKLGHPQVRMLLNIPSEGVMKLTDPNRVSTELKSYNASQVVIVAAGKSVFTVDGKELAEINTKSGGNYVLLVTGNKMEGYMYKSHVITEPNSVHMMWQLPQIIAITAAETTFCVTGLEFSFTQAPHSMKSVLQACWLLSVAIGNVLVVLITKMNLFESQAAEFGLFAGLMVVDMLIFMVLAMRYQYVEHNDDETAEGDSTPSSSIREGAWTPPEVPKRQRH